MIFLLEGNEFFCREFLDEHLQKKFKGLNRNERNRIVRNPTTISAITDMGPFIPEVRVIIWDFDEFKKLERFNPYVIPKGVDIFVIGQKIDKRLTIVKSLESYNCETKLFKDLYASKIEGWIMTRCSKLGLKINPDAVIRLALYYGNNLFELNNFLLSCKDKNLTVLTIEKVNEFASFVNKFSIFELQDAITAKDVKKANYIAKQMFKNGEQPFGVLRYFLSFFEKLLIVKIGDEELVKGLSLHPYVLKKFRDLRISMEGILKCLDEIAACEKKVFEGDVEYNLQRLIFKLSIIK